MTVCLASSNKMDVTSLLNSSSAAAAAAALQRRDSVSSSTPSATGDTTAASTAVHTPSPDRTPPRRTSGSRSPSRNRTPWDAGGYSLPLTLDTKAIPSSPSNSRPNFYHNSDSPTDCGANASASPKSPKHKFSDSRSSLSSYSSSSNNSLSHSRISSLSTVSEYQPLTALITDISLDGKPAASNGMAEKIEGGPDRLSSFDSTPVGATQDDNRSSVGGSLHNDSLDRPESPSDAVMIRRGLDGLTGGLGRYVCLLCELPHKSSLSPSPFPNTLPLPVTAIRRACNPSYLGLALLRHADWWFSLVCDGSGTYRTHILNGCLYSFLLFTFPPPPPNSLAALTLELGDSIAVRWLGGVIQSLLLLLTSPCPPHVSLP